MGNCCWYNDNEAKLERQMQLLKDAEYKNTKEQTYNFTKAKVIKVYDGDTFWVAAWHNDQLVRFKVRLYGVDCSEMKDKRIEHKNQAYDAKQYVSDLLLNEIVDINVIENRKYNGKMQKEKWGRLLCVIHTHGVNVADMLIQQGLGKPYFGGTKEDKEPKNEA